MNITRLDPNVWRLIADHCTVRSVVRLSSTCTFLHEKLAPVLRKKWSRWKALTPDERLILAAVHGNLELLNTSRATYKGYAILTTLLELYSCKNCVGLVPDPSTVNTSCHSEYFAALKKLTDSPLPMTLTRPAIGPRTVQYSYEDIKTFAANICGVISSPIENSLVYEVAAHGDLGIITKLKSYIYQMTTSERLPIFRLAAQHGHTNILDWANGSFLCDTVKQCANSAIAGGSIESLKWYLRNTPNNSHGLSISAALYGQVDILEYLYTIDKNFLSAASYDICTSAITNDHLHVLQWVHSKGNLKHSGKLIKLAKKHMCWDIVIWLLCLRDLE